MEVKLFIYQESTIVIQEPISADSTLISADSTLITADRTFNSIYNVERTAIPIDLFNDEVISLTSSIQNINDISKIFTDYTQSFTVPASKLNNETFRHWYENEIDNGFNQLIRYDGFIEIDNEIFRVGKWQLESASVKQNKIENYKLTFYGVLTSLTDKFREDKLKDLETLNDYTIEYSGPNVETNIETTNNDDVSFPLISSSKVWQYGGGGSTILNWDISNNATPMSYTELFPALKIARIFDAIESKYNVSFQGNFLTQSRFTEAFLWLKNKETFAQTSAPVRIDISTISVDTGGQVTFDLLNNTYDVVINDSNQASGTIILNAYLSVNSTWIVSVFKDNQFYINQSGTGTAITLNLPNENGTYYLTIQTSSSCTYNSDIIAQYQEWNDPFGYFEWITHETIGAGSGATNSQLDLTQYVPDMKVSDFVSSILKMFNLTAFSENESVYTLEQLENWYYQGQIKNLTEYTITDLEFERIKPYKKINFEYEKSESFMNRAFFDSGAREYGNLSTVFNTDGNDYTIKLPFENLLFNKFTGINLQVGYSINKTFQTYIPKPIILYKLGNVASGDFKFNNGTTTSTIANYNVFGQDVNYQNTKQTLNWGIEISSYYLNTITNTLFQNYYFNYLSNLYSLKSRMVKVSMRLPYSELLYLKLNDRIVIRDKRYIINQFTTNLQTFEVQMELIQDFRNILFDNSIPRTIDSSAQTLRFDTTSVEPLTWEIQQDLNGQIISINDFDSYVEVETKANTTGVDLFYSIISNKNDIIVITQNG
jgi:hypothetical protein